MASPSKLISRQREHVIVFGDSKSGKSTLVAGLMKHGFKLWWISMDGGHTVCFKLGLPIEELDRRLDLIQIPDSKENPVAIRTCNKIMSGMPQNICDTHGICDCATCKQKGGSYTTLNLREFGPKDILVFDHSAQIAKSALSAVVNKMAAKQKPPVEPDDYKPEWDDYRVQGALMDRFFTNIQSFPCHVIVISQVTESVMEDKSKKLLPVIGTSSFSGNAGQYFDTMIYCEVLNSKHRAYSGSTAKTGVVTGCRYDFEIEKMSEPSLHPLFDGSLLPKVIEEDKKEAADKLEALMEQRRQVSLETIEEALEEDAGQIDEQAVALSKSVPAQSPGKQPAATTPVSPASTVNPATLAMLAKLRAGKGS
jgi:hypothetical protein